MTEEGIVSLFFFAFFTFHSLLLDSYRVQTTGSAVESIPADSKKNQYS